MRRRPYSELLDLASPTGRRPATDPPKTQSLPASPSLSTAREEPSRPPLREETVLGYQAEIRKLSGMIQIHDLTADSGDRATCSFIAEKLAEASGALDRGDEEASWVHLFGAATLWQNTVNNLNSQWALQRIEELLK